jgi:DNA-binding HxlR family transcriptional regulator
VCGGDRVEWLHVGDARGEAARFDQRRKLSQARSVGADPDIVNARAAQSGGRGPGGGGKRTAVADGERAGGSPVRCGSMSGPPPSTRHGLGSVELGHFEHLRPAEAMDDECPSRQVLDAISDKWVTLVLSALADGPQRYSDLSRRIAGVSQKMLTQTVRQLERDRLVTRTITPAVPVRVDYELIALGETILPVVVAIKRWSEAHITEIHAAREIYDRLARG